MIKTDTMDSPKLNSNTSENALLESKAQEKIATQLPTGISKKITYKSRTKTSSQTTKPLFKKNQASSEESQAPL
jgi:hypothetical protein